MLHNMEINDLMTAISLNLSSPGREPNHELWTVYGLLQAWKMDVEWDHPGIGIDRSQEIAAIILKELETLPDQLLAKEIERTVKHCNLQAVESKNTIADCGTVITDWQANQADIMIIKHISHRR